MIQWSLVFRGFPQSAFRICSSWGILAAELGVSKSYAYKIVQKLNAELKAKGYLTISGRINRKYFMEKLCYNGAERKDS